MSNIRNLAAALAVVALCACGGDSSSPSNPTDPNAAEVANQTFVGTLADGSLVTLSFSAAQALVAEPRPSEAGAIAISGSITVPGTSTSIPLTGSYDPATGKFSVSGGGYSLTGTYAAGMVQGDCTTPSGPVKFAAMRGGATVTRYCGTFTDANKNSGPFNLMIGGGKAYGMAQGGVTFSGTESGGAIAMTDSRGGPVNGAITGTKVSGTFTNGDGPGTWTGSVEACGGTTPPPPPPSGACNTITGSPTAFTAARIDQSPPAAAGGAIADGTYHLSAVNYYGSDPSGTAYQQAFVVSGSTLNWVVQRGVAEARVTATLSASGTALTLTITCSSDPNMPVGSQVTVQYSATASGMKWYQSATKELVLTKQ